MAELGMFIALVNEGQGRCKGKLIWMQKSGRS